MASPGDACIEKLLADPSTFPTSVDPRVANHLYQLVIHVRPTLVFETGSHIGFSSLHIAKALRENGHGKLVSFDTNIREVSRNIEQAQFNEYVELVSGDSAVQMRVYLTEKRVKEIDIAFIDGDHTRRGCVRDFESIHSHIKVGGYVIFHDIHPEICGWKGPRFVLNILKRTSRCSLLERYEVEEIHDLDPFGFAVCRKISSGENPLGERSLRIDPTFWLVTSKPAALLELTQFFWRRTHNPLRIMYRISKILMDLVKKRL